MKSDYNGEQGQEIAPQEPPNFMAMFSELNGAQ